MLISDSHNFIFVHVSKAAGSSVHQILSPYANPVNAQPLNKVLSKTGLRKNYQKYYFAQHAYLSEAQKVIPPERFQELFKFAFVRNPWDWIVSMYSFLKQTKGHRHNAAISTMSFAEYVAFEIKRNKRFQYLFLCDTEGQPLTDFNGRFEQLDTDFKVISERLGLEIQIPHRNASKHRDFREYYDPKLKAAVADHWRKDIELFEYEFD